MKHKPVYRLTIGDAENRRQYHLQSRWVLQIYVQTYVNMGKKISIEQLIDGTWKQATI